ncbi:AMP-binding protein [Nocardiopsis sp. NPDC006832]|uniref:phenylacetate--CoA ligase family protein n=1 Tax=Nocardiopsis sp. NPDC006832 TaxID=3157188 RepID=UPI0033D404CE
MRTALARDLPVLGDWRGFDELHRLQEERVAWTLERALRTPFHQGRLRTPSSMTGIDDLSDLPVTGKSDLRDAYPFGLLAVERERLATYHESSGTSGAPTASYFTDGDWEDVADRFARSRVGLGPADTVMVRTPYAMLTTGHQAHRAARARGATVVPADNRTLVVTGARVVRLLRDLDVTVAWSLPTECLLWGAAARFAGMDPGRDFPSLRSLLVAGESLTPARRAAISRLWGGIPVIQDYGSTETGSLAGECPQGRLHLWADRFLPQVYDPATGRSSRTGMGHLVITTLYREAMPLVRYDLADRVRIREEACECGWWLPTVEVLGREAEVRGTGVAQVSQSRLEAAVFSLPERYGVLFWRARTTSDHLEVEVEAVPEHADRAAAELEDALRAALGVECRVRGRAQGELVPESVLSRTDDFVKPRSLFGADEDWDRAFDYH